MLLNEATPVIGDIAMETITETVITESAMIGHNPSTPGGQGLGQGRTIALDELADEWPNHQPWIVIVPVRWNSKMLRRRSMRRVSRGVTVAGAIVQKDDGVLINNRLQQPMPIVDEVKYIDRVPMGMPAAVEVARPGRTIEKLCNPYDIATLFHLDSEETKRVVPIARALMGTRSAVVIKTPKGDIEERRIPAGKITLIGHKQKAEVPVDEGADAIMAKVATICPLEEIHAEAGTNVGGMFEQVRKVMADLTDQPVSAIRVQDIIAVDTFKPQQVLGASPANLPWAMPWGLRPWCRPTNFPCSGWRESWKRRSGLSTVVGGVEAEMAIRGALTTPGTKPPLATLDLGGGSTDASIINEAERFAASIWPAPETWSPCSSTPSWV